MSFNWQTKTLNDVCLKITDGAHNSPKSVAVGKPMASVKDLTRFGVDLSLARLIANEDFETLVKQGCKPEIGDVLIAKDGNSALDTVCTVKKSLEAVVLSSVAILRPDPLQLNSDFLKYYFSSIDVIDYLKSNFISGAAIPRVVLRDFKKAEIAMPPLEIQDEIASTLNSFDDRIALLRETNTTLEAIAQALFKSWFVDFDPVRAKQQGREPEGMDAETAALFPDSFEESELGLVPSGWQLVPFGELLCHTIGGDWGGEVADEKNDTRVAIIRGTDIPNLHSGTNNRVPVRYTSLKKLTSRKLQDGDIVLEVSGGSKDQPTGRALYLTDGLLGQFDCPVEPASFCRLLRPNTKDIGVLLAQHLTYIYAQGKTWEYQNQSTGISNFQTVHFLETELVVLPPDNVLRAFASLVKPMVDRTHLTQIKQLAELRDTLLPRLISGQLRLPEAEAMVEDS
ncbi:MAG: restriction endonuclease subunit S [Methylobacter sp.]|uniref:restriction endonuclease subunit S n=1 Tax=Methylobacter sp. TaxID=2051955 RepID=UPI0025E99784|nr:restriction endonuclease subunit S [Methylobacter sp.]MCK9623009.1 restriction endonuclease subunit S [Methylobacter sp.]